MDYRLELVQLPVTDVDRAKEFSLRLGFALDVDHHPNERFRVVQLTPPGSACSVCFGITDAVPGSVVGTHLVVADLEAARDELVSRGVEVGEIRHMTPHGWQRGVDPNHARYNSFTELTDPDGNGWVLQEVR
ncbi:Predicted lactoylglutathione lyase [Jatrophihabitans endophyticus]|uniref:Predicted lactoylglutathione lyase n=1 Tax=Jatrophihabitans endophyticus TaxID=1206085 RepID=A0A1M5KT71_9ACTN|nr:VOC family protein [Jatrophihabitans endophyticus]SHG55870.1 Predicted lactoylglutathione lyase [Jatrophihabitans endophyticus]